MQRLTWLLSLVPTSRFFINGARSCGGASTTLPFFHTPSNSSRLALAACETRAQTEQKQGVRGRTSFTCETNRPGVPGGHGKPESLFFQRGPTWTHLLPSWAEAGCECMPALLTSSESRDVGQAQRGSHYSPIGVSCDLKGR